jgi:hypothetical protein
VPEGKNMVAPFVATAAEGLLFVVLVFMGAKIGK